MTLTPFGSMLHLIGTVKERHSSTFYFNNSTAELNLSCQLDGRLGTASSTLICRVLKLSSPFSTDSTLVTCKQQKPQSFAMQDVELHLVHKLSSRENSSACRNDRAERSTGSHVRKASERVQMLEVEHCALESEVFLFYTGKKKKRPCLFQGWVISCNHSQFK